MSLAKSILNKFESKTDSKQAIQALIDTNFSASDEEKGKAASLLRGLFFSEDPEAKDFIKRLDDMLSQMKLEDINEK